MNNILEAISKGLNIPKLDLTPWRKTVKWVERCIDKYEYLEYFPHPEGEPELHIMVKRELAPSITDIATTILIDLRKKGLLTHSYGGAPTELPDYRKNAWVFFTHSEGCQDNTCPHTPIYLIDRRKRVDGKVSLLENIQGSHLF